MDIFIKSFNRPYYLERCILSVKRFVEGDYTIKILDDGTPSKYLEKIRDHHPDVQFCLSGLYRQKAKAIEAHIKENVPFNLFSIPVELWVNEISKASEVFLLLEDDIWLTRHLDLAKTNRDFEQNKLAILKLFWAGNAKLIEGKKKRLNSEIEEVNPQINLLTKALVKNTCKVRDLFNRANLLNSTSYFSVYSLYTVASAFFQKAYWLYIWQNAGHKVDESRQLLNAIRWKELHPKMKYSKMLQEITKTSFITSATNNFPEIPIDIMRVNYHLNELWLKGELNSEENMPGDFELGYISVLLSKLQDPLCKPEDWLNWVECFKNQYRKVGCVVE